MNHVVAMALLVTLTAAAEAQFQEGDPQGGKLGKAAVQRWRAGLSVEAVGGACKSIIGYVPFPIEWPEQDVKVVSEDLSPEVKISYETVEGTGKLLIVRIADIPADQTVKAVITFEVRRSEQLPPEDTSIYKFADVKKLDRKLLPYLAPSLKIESKDLKIRNAAKQIIADKEKAWERAEAIYDWTREKVKFKDGPVKGASAALKDGSGGREDITSLFIAVCRAADIPARTVWVPGHCYPEFYLVDDKGAGHWFPCQAVGERAFGGIPEDRPILQKGDNFHPPWNRRLQQRYLTEYLTGSPLPGGGQPRVKFLRELVP